MKMLLLFKVPIFPDFRDKFYFIFFNSCDLSRGGRVRIPDYRIPQDK
jgi:hypothetical protein